MIGYHYTSYANWEEIQKVGLIPTPLAPDKLQSLAHLNLGEWDGTGIWMWQHALGPESHAGTILFQASSKGTTRVVLLEVEYDPATRLCVQEGLFAVLYHHGKLGGWKYHTREPAWLLTKTVPAKNIRLLEVFDIVHALRKQSVARTSWWEHIFGGTCEGSAFKACAMRNLHW